MCRRPEARNGPIGVIRAEAAVDFAGGANLRHRFDSAGVSRHNSSITQLFVPHRETNTATLSCYASGRSP
jgi:hypothetical protein